MSKTYTVLIADSLAMRQDFQPFTLTRPGWDLRIGLGTLLEKWQWLFGAQGSVVGIVPEPLKGLFDGVCENNVEAFVGARAEDTSKHEWIILDSRVLPSKDILEWALQESSQDQNNLLVDNQVLGVKASDSMVATQSVKAILNGALDDTRKGEQPQHELSQQVEGRILHHLWDLFVHNGDEIQADITNDRVPEALGLKTAKASKLPRGVVCDNPSGLWLHPYAVIEPGTVCITTEGPIIVMDGAHVKAGSMLRGPLVIGHHTSISMGSKLYGNTTIGPWCKVGGEVKNSIFHSYSNKGHEGYLGNSVVGQWVNLGADTNTSNLKNNYGFVRIWNMAAMDWIESKQQYAGCFLGDHTKTSINTMLNTGTVTGVSAFIFGSGFPPKFIPSFAWMDASKPNESTTYDIDKAIVDMERMMSRRGVETQEVYKAHMLSLYKGQQNRSSS
ncbi:MAG: putative sugar nucleotidyl transferase [Balneolaceae bacterium]|nr:putative sugar nucleotidyl transferase [Balneolaceae bacterium]MDR9447122.1 putative sugar nucleotidyl transferase [Balneolaceae bacterium]